MRNKFEQQLETLNSALITMGATCENAIACSVKALTGGEIDTALAANAINALQEIDRMERDIEALCMKLLMQQQPVARDLRLISSALKMVTDMERVGDMAADIAELVPYARLDGTGCEETIRKMAAEVIGMVTSSVDSFVGRDSAAARGVVLRDDIVDGLFSEVKAELIRLIASGAARSETAVDVLMIAKYLERIGDHAVNIGGWVMFAVTGKHISKDGVISEENDEKDEPEENKS